ncbi:hypothetical protein X801_06951, partial [Opisthorchis viverrini]
MTNRRTASSRAADNRFGRATNDERDRGNRWSTQNMSSLLNSSHTASRLQISLSDIMIASGSSGCVPSSL